MPQFDLFVAALPNLLPELEELADRAPAIPLSKVAFDSPVANPGKLIGESEAIELRLKDPRNNHELELAAVIGKRASNVPAERALEYAADY